MTLLMPVFFWPAALPTAVTVFILTKDRMLNLEYHFPEAGCFFQNTILQHFQQVPRYHVVIEKKENVLTFKVNDILIEKLYDNFPALGINHQSIGVFL